MFVLGSLLALFCGLANSAAAALEKRELLRLAGGDTSWRLLAALVRRRWWLLAMALSALAWVAEAGALGLAPVPVVTTLRSAGRGGLVVAGRNWLGERFGRSEVAGVVLLAVGGIVTASSVLTTNSAAPPLSNSTELLVGAAAAAVAGACAFSGDGLVLGSVGGILFIATGVYTKEVGDRVVRDGGAAILPLLATPGPWIMVALTVWAIALLQRAFMRANAASVSAASTTVSSNGLIVAGLLLYHERLARGAGIIPLAAGIAISAAGAVALVGPSLPGRVKPGRQSAPRPQPSAAGAARRAGGRSSAPPSRAGNDDRRPERDGTLH